MATFVKNAWYMAGWAEELSSSACLSRRICGDLIAFYRKEDGGIAALEDRCPHRFAPLSMGKRDGDALICPYHALKFDASGQCVHNPFSDKIPATARVKSWACEERDGMIWMWGGAPEKADPDKIPDFEAVRDVPGRKVLRSYTHVKAPYEYCTDNLLDLSHIETVHAGTFGGEGVIYAGTFSVIDEKETLHCNWWAPNVPAPAPTRPPYEAGQMTDHWLDMRWNAPASMKLDIGATLPGRPRGEGVDIGGQAHIVTPETETTSHYFICNARTTDIDSAEVDAFLTGLFDNAFNNEDKPIIEAAYANVGAEDFWSAKPISLGVDQGATRARRKIEAMLKAENG